MEGEGDTGLTGLSRFKASRQLSVHWGPSSFYVIALRDAIFFMAGHMQVALPTPRYRICGFNQLWINICVASADEKPADPKPMDTEGSLYLTYCTVLYKGLAHPGILISSGLPGTNP